MSQFCVAVRVNLKMFIFTFYNPCLNQALLFQRTTYSYLLLVAFINFCYILMPVCPSNMQDNFHNNNNNDDDDDNNNNKSSNKKIVKSTEHCIIRPSILALLAYPLSITLMPECIILRHVVLLLCCVVLCPACF